MAITAEAAELMQHFVWQSSESSLERAQQRKEEVSAEMADVAILLLEFAEVLGVDLGGAVAAKLEFNEQRYPVSKAFASNKKYNEL